MPAVSELIANNLTVEQIQGEIGADRLFYQDHNDLIDAASEGNPQITNFDTSCFSNKYVTGDVNSEYFAELEVERSDGAKRAQEFEPSELRDVSQMSN
jgi:amidophosphoribosyltransferase